MIYRTIFAGFDRTECVKRIFPGKYGEKDFNFQDWLRKSIHLNIQFHIMIVDDKMKINNKFNLEGVGPNSLKKEIMNRSLSVQISVAFFNKVLSQFKDKDYLECIKSLDSVIKYNLINTICYIFKTLVLGLVMGRYGYVIDEIDKSLRLSPHSENIYKLKKELLRLQFNNNFYNYFV